MKPVQTLEAFLPSDGYDGQRATRHRYTHSEPVSRVVDGRTATGIGHFFRCIETGVSRQWGFDQYGAGSLN